jgi:3-hydroxy-9,10-secoandrosta-1,3,5(10)-triene-9,17-dione monooxygenase reductase component
MRRTGRFAVNILGRQHKPFARRSTPAGADRFAGIDWQLGDTGVPLLTDAVASFECEIVAEHPAGDHWIVVGQVTDLHVSPVADPLIFFAGAFGAPQQQKPDNGATLAQSPRTCSHAKGGLSEPASAAR